MLNIYFFFITDNSWTIFFIFMDYFAFYWRKIQQKGWWWRQQSAAVAKTIITSCICVGSVGPAQPVPTVMSLLPRRRNTETRSPANAQQGVRGLLVPPRADSHLRSDSSLRFWRFWLQNREKFLNPFMNQRFWKWSFRFSSSKPEEIKTDLTELESRSGSLGTRLGAFQGPQGPQNPVYRNPGGSYVPTQNLSVINCH